MTLDADTATSSRDRLIAAARNLVVAGESLSIEAAAAEAQLSRATAYRVVGTLRDFALAVMMERITEHRRLVTDLLGRLDDPVAQVEETVVYTVTRLREDLILNRLLPQAGIANDADLRNTAIDFIRPVIDDGQRRRRIRDDISVEEVTDWLLKCFVDGTASRAHSDAEARSLFRTFFVPGLVPYDAAQRENLLAAHDHLRSALNLLG